MKRIFFASLILFSILSGCNTKEDSFLEVDANSRSLNFGVEASYQTITVDANVAFRATSSHPEWCTAVVLNFPTDNLGISVKTNATFDVRHATVTISADGVADVTITVNQLSATPVLSVIQNHILIGGSLDFSLDVHANFPIVFDLPAWISEKEGNIWTSGAKKYSFTAFPFFDPLPSREATITVRAASSSVNIQPVSVSIVQLSDGLQSYVTLKCDFHIHTVFSDGTVWPVTRVEEAYRDGLDVMSITDHLEARYRTNLPAGYTLQNTSHNTSYDLAEAAAKEKGIILIRGSEISRDVPPGHHGAIFLSDCNELDKSDYMDAFRAAKARNAFLSFNHPQYSGYGNQINVWFPVLTQLLSQEMMHGIEIVNNDYGGYSPIAHRWCLDNKLTMLGGTDTHYPIPAFAVGKHRTMTLVFARSRTPEAIYEALMERRTAVYHGDNIIGEEKYLKQMFENALQWSMVKNGNNVEVTVKNNSDLPFHMKTANLDPRLVVSVYSFTITPKGTYTLTVSLLEGITGGDLNFSVENFLVEPNVGMKYTVGI